MSCIGDKEVFASNDEEILCRRLEKAATFAKEEAVSNYNDGITLPNVHVEPMYQAFVNRLILKNILETIRDWHDRLNLSHVSHYFRHLIYDEDTNRQDLDIHAVLKINLRSELSKRRIKVYFIIFSLTGNKDIVWRLDKTLAIPDKIVHFLWIVRRQYQKIVITREQGFDAETNIPFFKSLLMTPSFLSEIEVPPCVIYVFRNQIPGAMDFIADKKIHVTVNLSTYEQPAPFSSRFFRDYSTWFTPEHKVSFIGTCLWASAPAVFATAYNVISSYRHYIKITNIPLLYMSVDFSDQKRLREGERPSKTLVGILSEIITLNFECQCQGPYKEGMLTCFESLIMILSANSEKKNSNLVQLMIPTIKLKITDIVFMQQKLTRLNVLAVDLSGIPITAVKFFNMLPTLTAVKFVNSRSEFVLDALDAINNHKLPHCDKDYFKRVFIFQMRGQCYVAAPIVLKLKSLFNYIELDYRELHYYHKEQYVGTEEGYEYFGVYTTADTPHKVAFNLVLSNNHYCLTKMNEELLIKPTYKKNQKRYLGVNE
uniref:F-box domain-containing protein n=1 Tax=Rhabditophanes sp. KR3021 TaxID=114890 RepID=A0AC35TSP0_9BILA